MIENLVAAGKMEPRHHAQSRPPTMQADGVARALRVGEMAKAPVFIVHVSCEAAMNEIVRSRDEGHASFGETCTQYLVLTEKDLDDVDARDLAGHLDVPVKFSYDFADALAGQGVTA